MDEDEALHLPTAIPPTNPPASSTAPIRPSVTFGSPAPPPLRAGLSCPAMSGADGAWDRSSNSALWVAELSLVGGLAAGVLRHL